MRIALIIKDLRHCGAQRVIARLSFILHEAGHEVYMVLFSGKDIDYEYAGKLVVLDTTMGKSALGKIICTFKRSFDLKKLKRTYRFDAAISFLDTPNIANILTKGDEKVFVSVRNYKSLEDKGLFDLLNRVMIKFLYPRANKVIVVSKEIMKDMSINYKIPRSRMCVIYNPFDIDQISLQSKDALPDEYNEFYHCHAVIVSVGRLSQQKGYWNLIKSFMQLKSSHPDAGLVIIGDGEQEGQLKDLVNDLNLVNDVIFAGYQKNPFPFIVNAKLYAMTSLFEGFPNALVEAMACGTPVVSTDCKSGPREILFNNPELGHSTANIEYADYGIICPAFTNSDDWNPKHFSSNQILFANAMANLLEDESLYLKYSTKAKKRAANFSFGECKTKYLEILGN